MYITINDIIGEKTIDLSYSIRNFSSSKEIAVTSMLSKNAQYEMTKPLKLKFADGSEKEFNTYNNKTNDLILNLTPENVTEHSGIE